MLVGGRGREMSGLGFRMPTACAVISPGSLLHRFDGVPPDCLEGLVTLRGEVIPSLRFIKCFRLLQAVPLSDGDPLGCCPLQSDPLSPARVQVMTTSSLLRSLNTSH